jgi:hypothetical protein
MGRDACSQLATVHVFGRAPGTIALIRQVEPTDYELLEKSANLRGNILAFGGRIPAGAGALLRGAFAPVGTQFSDEVQRARGEHGVLRAGPF